MSKFVNIEKVALKFIDRFFLYLERRKRYRYYKHKELENCPTHKGNPLIKYMLGFFVCCWFLVFGTIAVLGWVGDDFIMLSRNAACLLHGKQEYCDLNSSFLEKKQYCEKFIKNNLEKICRPINTNLIYNTNGKD